jgi:hypothetical protein
VTSRVDYRGELKKHRAALALLLAEREDVEVKIARLKKKVAAFAELCDEGEAVDPAIDLDLGGLTDVCKTAMRASRKEWMTIAEIQKTVEELGFPLEQYKAPAASITTTVNRLADSEEVEVDRRLGESVKYKWVGKRPVDAMLFRVKARGLSVAIPKTEEAIGTPPSLENAYERSLKGKK